jgi:hypothetical protein
LGADAALEDDVADGLPKDGLAAMADKVLVEGAADVMAVAVEEEATGIARGALEGGGLGKAHAERPELHAVGASGVDGMLEHGVLEILDDVGAVSDGGGEGIAENLAVAVALVEVEQRPADGHLTEGGAGGGARVAGRER